MNDVSMAGPTLVQEILTARDFTAVLVAVQSHADELPANAEGKQVLIAAATLDSMADSTRATVQQMLAFLPRLESVILPRHYEETLAEVESACAGADTPDQVIAA